jgi:hypothetical protein
MVIANVQNQVAGSSIAVSSISATVTAVGSGNLVCGFVETQSQVTTDLTSVTDNAGNTYTIVDNVARGGGFNGCLASFYLANITNAPTSITATLGTANACEIMVSEYSGVATTSPLDGHAMQFQGSPGTGANGVTSGNITTTINGDLIFGGVTDTNGSSNGLAAGSGFASRILNNTANGNFQTTEDQIQASAGVIAATFTATVIDVSITGVMAFSPPVAVGSNTLMGAACL